MTWWLWLAIGLIPAVLIVSAVNRISRWAGERGWVYNKHNPRRPGSGVGSLGLFEEVFQPSVRHVIEEQSSERLRAEQDESGDGHHPGGTRLEGS